MGEIRILILVQIFICCIVFAKGQDLNLIADVEGLGKFQGKETTTVFTSRPYAQFLGIPYAKSPAGSNRFLPPEPTGRLTEGDEIFDATRLGMSCIQPNPSDLKFYNTESGNSSNLQMDFNGKEATIMAPLGEEDCLRLNIFTPKLPEDGAPVSLPVIVFIHGGAYSSGNGDFYNGKKLLEHDVVVVSINYRLGVLGFFCLDTNDAPGNAALYDMVTALQWVQQYISAFGGNPDLVTVTGQSAGSASVSHLMLSELSKSPKPLFHRAIAMSGSAMNSWAVTTDPIQANLRVAELALCYDPINDIVEENGTPDYIKIVSCMKETDPANLVSGLIKYQQEERKEGRLGFDALSPVVQKAGSGTKFLAKHPVEILEAGEQLDIPLIMGATKHEGTFPLGVTYNRFLSCEECGEKQNNATFLQTDLIPNLLESMKVFDNTYAVYDTLSTLYLKDSRYTGEFDLMIPGLIDLNSVFFFKAAAFRNLELHSKQNPNSYWYSFEFKTKYTLFPIFFPPTEIPPIPSGIAHGDDLLTIFHFFAPSDEIETNVFKNLIQYWVNFAYHGGPNQYPPNEEPSGSLTTWPTYSENTGEYLVIHDEFSVKNDYAKTWVDASLDLVEPENPVTPPPPAVIIDVEGLGKIQGREQTTLLTKRPYVHFLGIPYAKAPIGESRFLPPEPKGRLTENDEDIFVASSFGQSCVQPDGFGDEGHFAQLNPENPDEILSYLARNSSAFDSHPKAGHLGEEDCLMINVFTPKIPETVTEDEKELLPVIVFIHGGAFTSGNADFYTGKKLLEKDVVLVSFNYRLGILGFFSLETNDAPGNAALYDMITALNWVQDHIRAFGGNPNLVTIAGQSAGACSVSHLMLSEMSREPRQLFHRAISLSGSSMNGWAVTSNPIPSALRIAELAECFDPIGDVDENGVPDNGKITACMKTIHVDNLVSALFKYQLEERKEGRLGFDPISPVVQKTGPGTLFLSKTPTEILEAGEQIDIPFMSGATKHDGTFPLGVTYNRFLSCADCEGRLTNATFLRTQLIPALLHSMGVEDATQAVHDALADKFLGESRNSGSFDEMMTGLIDLHSVFFFKAGAFRNLELHSHKNPNSFWYSFDFKGVYTLFPIFFPPTSIPPIPSGVAHSDDLLYIFHFFTHATEDEKTVSENMINYWVNFAYNGNPNQFPHTGSKPFNYNVLPRWPAFDAIDREYLIIDADFQVSNNYMGSWVNASTELVKPTSPSTDSTTVIQTTDIDTQTDQTTTKSSSILILPSTFSIYMIIACVTFQH